MFLKGKFLTIEMVEIVFNTFEWPEPFFVEDIGDGINVSLPKSNFTFCEDEMWERLVVQFLPEDTKEDHFKVTIEDAINVFEPEVKIRSWDFFHLNGPHSHDTIFDAVKRNTSLIHQHLMLVLKGDFTWVSDVKEKRPGKR